MNMSTPHFCQRVFLGLMQIRLFFFGGEGAGVVGVRERRGLICPLMWIYKHQKAFYFRPFRELEPNQGPWTSMGLRSQTRFRGTACCRPHIVMPPPLIGGALSDDFV